MKQGKTLLSYLAVAVLFSIIFLLPTKANAVTVNQDIVGTWGYQWIETDSDSTDSEFTDWASGGGTLDFIDGTGGTTKDFGTGSEDSDSDVDGVFSHLTDTFTWTSLILVDGMVEVTLNYDSGDVKVLRMVISDDGDVALIDKTYPVATRAGFASAVRLGDSTCAPDDLLGNSYYSSVFIREALEGGGFSQLSASYKLDMLSGSTYSYTDAFENKDGSISAPTLPADSTYSVSGPGCADSEIQRGTYSDNFYYTPDKNVFIAPYSRKHEFLFTEADTWGIQHGLKAADQTYVQADLVGTWIISSIMNNSLDSGEPLYLPPFSSAFGILTCYESGYCSPSWYERSGPFLTVAPWWSEPFTVNADGTLSVYTFGDLAPAFAGAIGNNGNTMIFNQSYASSDTTRKTNFVAIRCSTCDLAIGTLGSISGTLSYSGAETGQLYAFAYEEPVPCVNTGDLPEPVSIEPAFPTYGMGLPIGQYYIYASLDTAWTNPIQTQFLDPWGEYGGCASPIMVEVAWGSWTHTNIDITLVDGTLAEPNPIVEPYKIRPYSSCDSGDCTAWTGHMIVEDPYSYATSIEVTTGYGVVAPVSLTTNDYPPYGPHWQGQLWGPEDPGSTPLTYTVSITDPQGTREVTGVITDLLTASATDLSPNGAQLDVIDFTWTTPGPGYISEITLYNDLLVPIWGASTTDTSYTYDYGYPLVEGELYYWTVSLYDKDYNRSKTDVTSASFTYGTAVSTPQAVAWADNTGGTFQIYAKVSTDNGATWITRQLTNNSGVSEHPVAAVDPSTNIIYVAYQDDTASPGAPNINVKYSLDMGNTWYMRELTKYSSSSRTPTITAGCGSVYVAWSDDYYGNDEIFLRKSNDSGNSWIKVNRMTKNSGASASPSLGIQNSSCSSVYLAWSDDTGLAVPDIFVKSSADSGASWTLRRLTSNPGSSITPKVAVNGLATVYVTWVDDTNGGDTDIYLKISEDAGINWSNVKTITGNNSVSEDVTIAADSGGRVFVAWKDNINAGIYNVYMKTSLDNGATWGNAKPITTNSGTSRQPLLIRSEVGTELHMLWVDSSYGNDEIFMKTSSDYGATWNLMRMTNNSGFSWFRP